MANPETPTQNEPDYYAIIGVPADATPEEIRRVYGERARDAQGDAARFAALSAAHEVLKDAAKRAAYDRRRAQAVSAASGAGTMRTEEPTRSSQMDSASLDPLPDLTGGRTAVMGGPAATRQMGASFALPTVCAVDLNPCPLLSGAAAADDGFCPECGFLLGGALGGSVRQRPMPKLVDQHGREFPLKMGENIVGREGADVVVPHNTVSRRHASLQLDGPDNLTLEDLGSTNGTRVAGSMIPKNRRTGLRDRMMVQFGAVKLTVIMPELEEEVAAIAAPEAGISAAVAAIAAPEGGASARLVAKDGGVTHTLMAERVTFGRRSSSDVVMKEDSYISGSHAEITYQNGAFVLTDVGSTNGTFVNGKRLEPNAPVTLKDRDEVTMGTTDFIFHAPAG
jgi:pSer/pThr/pTyr-binding forkhead associated (FHA) protein